MGCCEGDVAILLINCEKTLGYNKKLPLRYYYQGVKIFIHQRESSNILKGFEKLDELLGCIIQAGSLIEIIGKKGSGKTDLTLLICAINSINRKKTLYGDGSGNFRPEKINQFLKKMTNNDQEITKSSLKRIIYQRIYEIDEITNLIRKIKVLDIDCVILDNMIPKFLYRHNGNSRLEIRKFVREIALIALTKKICIIFTSTIIEKFETNQDDKVQYELFYHDIIRYVHIKMLIQERNKEIINCNLIYPKKTDYSKLTIEINTL